MRVRLLIDDLYTGNQHEALAALATYERVEVRVFNPFAVRGGGLMQRFISSLDDFGRLQMRMHNKLLIADGAFAITGGRNVADEYYWQSEDSAFVDLDALITGPVVADMAGLFDLYWNSERVWPIVALSRPERDLDKRRSRFDAFVAAARLPAAPTVSVDLLGYGRLGDEIERGQVRLHSGRAQAVADAPTKVLTQQPDDGDLWAAQSEIRRVINGVMRAAESETTIITPYFVPGTVGVARTKANHERGVRVRILTNSLASTDEPVVHTGYRRYRKAMLRAGAELYEIDALPSARLALTEMRGRPVLRIHTKAGIVDRPIVYLGSMNFDPRSAELNTETGVIIESEAFARDVLLLVGALMDRGAWKLSLAADGELQWSGGARLAPLTIEPPTTFWQRMRLNLLSVLVPESVL